MISAIDSNRPFAWRPCVTTAMVLTMVCLGCNAAVEGQTELLGAKVESSGAEQPPRGARSELRLRALEPIGVYETGVYNESAAEITAYDPGSKRLFVVNGSDGSITVLDLSDPRAPIDLDSLDLSAYGAAANSVAVHDGLVAVAVEAHNPQDPGVVVLVRAASLEHLNHLQVGAMPDMLRFSPDGARLVIACEGEPDTAYFADPKGVIAIIELGSEAPDAVAALTAADVEFADFESWEYRDLDPGVRIKPGATVARDLEPEYIAISPDSRTAWVTLQENNALAIVDLASATVTAIVALGHKDHSLPGFGLDPNDADQAVTIGNWPVFGMYMPDAIAHFSVEGQSYVVTANEGDVRAYAAFADESRVDNLILDPLAFPDAAALQTSEQLGRLNVSTVDGDLDGDGDFDRLYAFGTRSIAVWSAAGELVWDSGDALERITAAAPEGFNSSNHRNHSFDGRSDKRGPEPEGVTVAELWGRPYAFVGLERVGGVVVYDLSNPRAPSLVLYDNSTRDWRGVAADGGAGDLGPEGLEVVSAADSPIGEPLLIVANEVSGTVRIYRIVAQ